MGNSMFDTLKNAFRIQDLRRRILFTLFAIIIYRLGIAVPIAGIDATAFAELFQRFGQLGQFLQIISGTDGFRAVSILSLGISPYINASIIMQLLTVAIPSLQRLSQEGEDGRKKIQKLTRYFTIIIALLMSWAYWSATRGAGSSTLPPFVNALVVILGFTAGSAFVMWLGEQINDKGIGNGISLMIFAGIVARFPRMLSTLYLTFLNWANNKNVFLAILGVILVVVVFIAVITLVVYIQSSERKIPVQYAKRVVGRKVYGGQSSYLPIKVNQSGVLPIIFAISIMVLPSMIISLSGSNGPVAQWFQAFDRNPLYYIVYALLIVVFTFFYSSISFNPVEVSNNLQKNGGFIPGIRPGRPTAEYISAVSRRLSWFEAIFLIFIVLFPSLLSLITKTSGYLWFGGTAVLIVVGVAMDIVNQLEAQMLMRHYKTFLD